MFNSLRFLKLHSLLHKDSILCKKYLSKVMISSLINSCLGSKMKLLVIFLFSFCLSAEARKFKTAAEVREHLEKVEYEELSRAAETTAKDALVLAKELDRVMKAENRLPDLTGCINCAVELIPNVLECLPGGLDGFLTKLNAGCVIKNCLCGFLDLIPVYGMIIKQVLGILGICAR